MTQGIAARRDRVDTAAKGPIGQIVDFFRLHWTRGPAGRETPRWVLLMAYRTWLIALLFKMLGSSWDMSWHFKWLRDDLAPPHLVNTVGTGIVIVLVAIHTFTGFAVDKRSLRLMQWGTAIFLVAAPLDVINHRINGLDLTAWSASHFMLFLGTALMIAGVIDGWMKFAAPGRTRTLMLGALWVFLLENVLFPQGQQEYGVLELASWDRGQVYAEPSLLQFAADQMGRPVDRDMVIQFALPVDGWVYPMWGIGVAALVLVAAAKTIGRPWAATAVAATYVAYRALVWPILGAADFPLSTVPFYLVLVGLAVDMIRRVRQPRINEALVGGVAVTALGYAALWVQDTLVEAPPVTYWTAPITAVGLAALWWSGGLLAQRLSRPASDRPSAGARTPG